MGNGAVPRLLAVAAALLALSLPAQAGAATPAPPPKLPVKAAIVTALNTGQRLYGLNAEQELAIASTTKLMTALQTFEHASLQQTFTEPDYHFAPDDSQIYLTPGERMSVHDLMIAMLLPSADDAAEDLAYNVGGGSVSRFVAMMNQGARKLGLTHTHYSTPIGLDTPGNYSSASDLVKLAGYLLEHYPFFAQVVALPSAVLKTGDHPRYVVNRNDLVARFSLDPRCEDGPHRQGRVRTCGRGTPRRHDAPERCARDAQRGRPRRKHARPPPLGLCELPDRDPPDRRRGRGQAHRERLLRPARVGDRRAQLLLGGASRQGPARKAELAA